MFDSPYQPSVCLHSDLPEKFNYIDEIVPTTMETKDCNVCGRKILVSCITVNLKDVDKDGL